MAGSNTPENQIKKAPDAVKEGGEAEKARLEASQCMANEAYKPSENPEDFNRMLRGIEDFRSSSRAILALNDNEQFNSGSKIFSDGSKFKGGIAGDSHLGNRQLTAIGAEQKPAAVDTKTAKVSMDSILPKLTLQDGSAKAPAERPIGKSTPVAGNLDFLGDVFTNGAPGEFNATKNYEQNSNQVMATADKPLTLNTAEEAKARAEHISKFRDDSETTFNQFAEIEKNAKPGEKLEKEGDAIVKRNERGEEIFRREGSVVTITKDGRSYVMDEKTGTREVWSADGKLELRRYSSGLLETSDGGDGLIRVNPNTGATWMTDKNGNIISDIRNTTDGGKILEVQNTKILTVNETIDTSDAAALAALINQKEKEGFSGVIHFKNGSLLVNMSAEVKDANGKVVPGNQNRKSAFISHDGTVMQEVDGAFVFRRNAKDAKGNLIGEAGIVDAAGKVHMAGSAIYNQLKARIGEGELEKILAALNNGKIQTDNGSTIAKGDRSPDSSAATPKFSSITAENGDVRTTNRVGGIQTATVLANGAEVNLTPGTTTTDIKLADGRRIRSDKDGTTTIGDIKADRKGAITDLRNGTRMDDNGMRTTDGTSYNSRTGTASFSDGTSVDSHGSVFRTQDGSPSQKAQLVAMESKALSAAASAESMAASVMAKAASGRVTSGDIAALSSTLGGLEYNLKALADQSDLTAMVRLMMTKGTVSESLAKATQLTAQPHMQMQMAS